VRTEVSTQETEARNMRSAVLLALALGAALAALVALMGTAREAEAAFPGANGKIVFSSNKVTATNPTGDYEISTMNPDGSQLTDNTGSDERYPALSPDGQYIAFMKSPDGVFNPDIYVMPSDGGVHLRLTYTGGVDNYPDWSPDGTKIVFESNYEIFTMRANGADKINLTKNDVTDRNPAWSPDGKKIVFVSNLVTATNPTGGYEIFTMNSDGTRKKARTNIDHFGTDSPDWQPLLP
jgi:Tol biopolymer transport system component